VTNYLQLIDKYETAKKDNNTEFLGASRIVHRIARSQAGKEDPVELDSSPTL
jgi:hypothetical protein